MEVKENDSILWYLLKNIAESQKGVPMYEKRKARAREKAIEWQLKFGTKDVSYDELLEAGNYFEKLGKRYGLLKEFRENGIL